MPATTDFDLVAISKITVPEDRIRKDEVDLEPLKASISKLGLINPITITRDYELRAGFCRLSAIKALGWATIPAQYYEDLDENERLLIEIEENIKRKNLNWQDEAIGIARYCEIVGSVSKTAEDLGMSDSSIQRYNSVAAELQKGNERIEAAPGFKAAFNIIERQRARAVDNELASIAQVEQEEEEDASPDPTQIRSPDKDLIVSDFIAWSNVYDGKKFNLIHCDFPYGVNLHDSEQAGSEHKASYLDTDEVYWELCNQLATKLSVLTLPSAHIFFWLPIGKLQDTITFFEKAGLWVLDIPMIWYKSDGKGIVSDVERRPRHVYEAALLMSRGDRKIITPVGDCYAAPTHRHVGLHISEKPEPVLKHFFRMLVDEYTELLDPTCGSGSAIRAAEELGAKRVLGLDLEEENIEIARHELRRARMLRKAAEEVIG